MNVLLVASEAAPLLSTSGVANVVSELALQLKRDGHDVRIALPKYRTLNSSGAERELPPFSVPMASQHVAARVVRRDYQFDTDLTIPFYLVDHTLYFARDRAYGYADDYERFIYFTRAVLEMLRQESFAAEAWLPEVIHGHDWITGLMPLWLRHVYADDPCLRRIASVYTIHNAGFPGHSSVRSLVLAGLDGLGIYPRLSETAASINFMGRGLLAADAVNTVSPSHAREIEAGSLAPDLAFAFRHRTGSLVGILNGVDETIYNTSWDLALESQFDKVTLARRKANKEALQREWRLDVDPDAPLFAMVGRLIVEKGVGLIEESIKSFIDDAQFILLGQPGDYRFRESFARLQSERPTRVSASFGHDSVKARRVFAGADVIMMPSLSEPCGLQQLLAMRYGALPLVRATGGLADTVAPWRTDRRTDIGHGFVFKEFTAKALTDAVRDAIVLHRNDRTKWRHLQEANMRYDSSWRQPAAKYMDLYERARSASTDRQALPESAQIEKDRKELLVQMLLSANEMMVGTDLNDYLRHIADGARELLTQDAVLIWSGDRPRGQRLRLAACSPGPIDSNEPTYQENPERSWSRQYVYRVDGASQHGEHAPPLLRAQAGFLTSRMAAKHGWKSQLSAPISVGGVLLGRIDIFSTQDGFDYQDWDFTALTALANAVGVSLERRRARSQREELLKLDRTMHSARSVGELATAVLESALEITTADRAVLRSPTAPEVIHEIDRAASVMESGGFHESATAVATNAQGVHVGEIEIVRRNGAPFSEDDTRALQALALQAGAALDAVQRRERSEKRRVDQLGELSGSLLGGDDFDDLLKRVITKTAEVLQAEAASLYLVNDQEQLLEIRAATGYHTPHYDKKASYKRGEGTTGWLWERGAKFKADSIDELHTNTPWQGKHKHLQNGKEPQGFMGLPLNVLDRFTHQTRVIGVLKFEDRRQDEPAARTVFSDEDFLLAEMMANIIAATVYNAQISGAQFQKLSNDLGSLAEALVGGQDVQSLVDNVVDSMAKALNVGASSLYLYDAVNDALEIRAATGYQEPLKRKPARYKPGEGITGFIFKNSSVVRANSLAQLRGHPAWLGRQNPHQNNIEPESFLGVPLTVRDRYTRQPMVIGVLKVEQIEATPEHPESHLTEQDERLVTMMANVIATVVYNAQVSLGGLKKLGDDLGSLSAALSGGRDLKGLVQEVVKTTAKVLEVGASSLYLYDEATRELVIHAATGYQEQLLRDDGGRERASYKPGQGITGWIFQKGEGVHAKSLVDLRRHPAWQGKQNVRQGDREPKTFLGVPLKVVDRFTAREKVIGVLKVENIAASPEHPEEVFTEQDVALVEMMASVIAAVVFNTQMGDDRLQGFGANLTALSSALSGSQEMGELVNQVVETTASVLGAEASSLYLYDDALKRLVIQAATGYQRPLVARKATYAPGEGLTGSIFSERRARRAETLAELRQHPGWKGAQNRWQGGREPNSFLGVPLVAGGDVIGVLKVENIKATEKHPEGYFTQQDEILVTMMGNVIATVVSNTRAGQARVGKVLKRLGTLAAPHQASRDLLAEYSKDEGLLDQMAIAIVEQVERNPSTIDAEARALFESGSTVALFRRIGERATNPDVRWAFRLYHDVIAGHGTLPTWNDVERAAMPWRQVGNITATPRQFTVACQAIVDALADATKIERTAISRDPLDQWAYACLDAAGVIGIDPKDTHRNITVFFPRSGALEQSNEPTMQGLLRGLDRSCPVVHVVLCDEHPGADFIREVRHHLSWKHAQDLVISSRLELIQIMAASSPSDRYRSLIFRQASGPLLFVTEGGVPDHMFFGREREILAVMEQIRANRSCIVLGGRKFGKTSLLHHLQNVRLPKENYSVVYCDARGMLSGPQFLEQPILAARWSGPGETPATFGQLLNRPPTNSVLLLDEPEALLDWDRAHEWHLFSNLRSRVNDKSLRIVLSGERALRGASTDPNGPLYNFAARISLAPLDADPARELVLRPFHYLEIDLPQGPAMVTRIYDLTHGHPSIIQRVCLRLVEDANKRFRELPDAPRQITLDDLERVIGDAAFKIDDYLKVWWERAEPLECLIALLMARTQGLRALPEIHAVVKDAVSPVITAADVDTALTDLTQLRCILRLKTNGAYEFAVNAFQDVAREVGHQMEYLKVDELRESLERGHHV